MRTQMPIVIRFLGKNMGSIPIDVCHGKIPDIFMTSMFGPTTEFELPDAKEDDGCFLAWLYGYRVCSSDTQEEVLEWSQCN